jgi:hypothetical protein
VSAWRVRRGCRLGRAGREDAVRREVDDVVDERVVNGACLCSSRW